MSAGVDGVAVFGFASEGFALTAAERAAILDVVCAAVGPDMPVVAGIAATGTPEAVEQARRAAEHGASAVMVVPPFMVKPSPAQIVDFYGTVARDGGLPVMVQDAPGPTGVTMPVSLIAELSKLEGVESVKVEAPPDRAEARRRGRGSGLRLPRARRTQRAVPARGVPPRRSRHHARQRVPRPATAGPRHVGGRRPSRSPRRIQPAPAAHTIRPSARHRLVDPQARAVRRGIIATRPYAPPAVDADPGTLAALADILDDLGI